MDEAGGVRRPPRAVKAEVKGARFQRDFDICLIGFPESVLPVIEEDVRLVSFLVPDWCTEVAVEWLDVFVPTDEPTNIAACTVSYSYRHASVTIRPLYFSPLTSDAERRANLAHEFLHILLAPLADYGRDRFEDLTDPETLIRQNLQREWKERVESVTSDLERALNWRRCEVSRATEQRRGGPAQATPKKG